MVYYLYVLKSLRHQRFYIGTTADLQNRILKHNAGSVRSTKAYRPWKIVHAEQFSDKTSARKRELFLKRNHKARAELFERMGHGPIV